MQKKRKGNCYVTAEALYHLLGGKAAGYTPQTVRHEGTVHWYLMYDKKSSISGLYTTIIIDPNASQFKTPPPYYLGRGRGFLTNGPSKRARAMMDLMVYQ